MEHYDIFISYRSEDGAQYARILQMQLEKTGYRVFLDYEELKRDRFGDDIARAIESAPIFLMVLTPLYLERCKEDGNWIKREIDLAIEGKKHFVPINPDRRFKSVPDGIESTIADVVENYQHSIIDFGPTLKVTYDLMVKNQILPVVKPHKKKWGVFATILILFVILIMTGSLANYIYHENKRTSLRAEIEKKHQHFGLYLNPDLSVLQMMTIDWILCSMKEVKTDSLWVSQYEFSTGWWNGIHDIDCSDDDRNIPITDISYGDVCMFIIDLCEMTNIDFALPSFEEWLYAAHGGLNQETTAYVGDDNVNNVAWYNDNSDGHVHPSDGLQGKEPNMLDIYDMSGNVSELCNNHFFDKVTICGGNYDSPASEVTISSCKEFDNNAKDRHVGFRIIIRKQ
jgi:hypothetical protein